MNKNWFSNVLLALTAFACQSDSHNTLFLSDAMEMSPPFRECSLWQLKPELNRHRSYGRIPPWEQGDTVSIQGHKTENTLVRLEADLKWIEYGLLQSDKEIARSSCPRVLDLADEVFATRVGSLSSQQAQPVFQRQAVSRVYGTGHIPTLARLASAEAYLKCSKLDDRKMRLERSFDLLGLDVESISAMTEDDTLSNYDLMLPILIVGDYAFEFEVPELLKPIVKYEKQFGRETVARPHDPRNQSNTAGSIPAIRAEYRYKLLIGDQSQGEEIIARLLSIVDEFIGRERIEPAAVGLILARTVKTNHRVKSGTKMNNAELARLDRLLGEQELEYFERCNPHLKSELIRMKLGQMSAQ